MEMWTILAVLVLIALLAPRYGVDSRWPGPGDPPPPPRPRPSLPADVAQLARRLRRASGVVAGAGRPAKWQQGL